MKVGSPSLRRRSSGVLLALLAASLVGVPLVPTLVAVPPAAADGNETPGNPAAVEALTVGIAHVCALLDDGRVKCWGWNVAGQLGLGDLWDRGDGPGEMGDSLPAVDLGAGRTATAVSANGGHTCAVLDDGQIKCWGNNDYGELGLGDTWDRGDGPGEMGDSLPAVDLGAGRTATAVAAGGRHSCALLDNGVVKCWGRNDDGELGLGDTATRGDGPGEMGDSLPAVDLGADRTATAITAGNEPHTCALLDNGQVKCWGRNYYGELGLGDTATRGDGPGEMGDSLPAVDLGADRTATAITAGTDGHTCALLDNGQVKCWGGNGGGQLGSGDTATRGDGPGEMGDSLPAVDLGADRTATAVTAGLFHTCAVLDNGQIKCWGDNDQGELGLGDTATRGDGPGQMGDSLPAVDLGAGRTATAVGAGDYYTCALMDDSQVKCWGASGEGALGSGDGRAYGAQPGQMGDNLPVVDLGAGTTHGVNGVWVAMGDSFSSGEGAAWFHDGTDTEANRCRRSDAYASLTNNVLDEPYAGGDFLFVACSGARIRNLSSEGQFPDSPNGVHGRWPQIEYLREVGADASVVTLTVGGNDMGFGDVLSACLGLSGVPDFFGGNSGSLAGYDIPYLAQFNQSASATDWAAMGQRCDRYSNHTLGSFAAAVETHIRSVRSDLVSVYDDVQAAAPNAEVYVLGYPVFIPGDNTATPSCGSLAGLNAQERTWLRTLILRANTQIRSAAATAGVTYVDVEQSFEGIGSVDGASHLMCDANADVNGITLSALPNSFHPDSDGHQTLAVRLFECMTSSSDCAPPKPWMVCDGQTANIYGTRGTDQLRGLDTAHRDVIVTLGGDDKVNALNGNDTVCGGGGADRLYGMGDQDRLFGAAGNDRLDGGSARDFCDGGTGSDSNADCESRTGFP